MVLIINLIIIAAITYCWLAGNEGIRALYILFKVLDEYRVPH